MNKEIITKSFQYFNVLPIPSWFYVVSNCVSVFYLSRQINALNKFYRSFYPIFDECESKKLFCSQFEVFHDEKDRLCRDVATLQIMTQSFLNCLVRMA